MRKEGLSPPTSALYYLGAQKKKGKEIEDPYR